MTISMHKFSAIFGMKLKAITDKSSIIYPLLTLVMAYGMRLMYGAMSGGDGGPEVQSALSAAVLNMGLMFSTSMTGMMLPCNALAEEKEKFTLRTLMTSSVNSLEFFLGSILPTVLVVTIMNFLLLPISGMNIADINILVYFGITFIATFTSTILGMLVGIFAKNQMSASTMVLPVMFLFTMVPMLSGYVASLTSLSKFLYTGVISSMISAYGQGLDFIPEPLSIIVLIGEMILICGLFVFFYKKSGYEAD